MTYTFSFCCQEYDNEGSRSQWMEHYWLTASKNMTPWEMFIDACLHPEHIDSEWEEDGFYQRIHLRLERGLFITRDSGSSFKYRKDEVEETIALPCQWDDSSLPGWVEQFEEYWMKHESPYPVVTNALVDLAAEEMSLF